MVVSFRKKIVEVNAKIQTYILAIQLLGFRFITHIQMECVLVVDHMNNTLNHRSTIMEKNDTVVFTCKYHEGEIGVVDDVFPEINAVGVQTCFYAKWRVVKSADEYEYIGHL